MGKFNVSVGFTGLLFLLFLGLKLGGVITWSWWYIFMPLYAPLLIGLILLIILWVFAKHEFKKMVRKW